MRRIGLRMAKKMGAKYESRAGSVIPAFAGMTGVESGNDETP